MMTVMITTVLERSPAARAELRAGDQIVEINNKAVHSLDDVRKLTADGAAGQSLRLLIRRGSDTAVHKLLLGDGL